MECSLPTENITYSILQMAERLRKVLLVHDEKTPALDRLYVENISLRTCNTVEWNKTNDVC
jgi:hypothetical protein